MKKHVFFCSCLLILCLLFSACANKNGSTVNETRTGGLQDPIAQYLRVGSGMGPGNPVCTVILSRLELEQYSDNYNRQAYGNIEYIDAIAKYSDRYFIDNFLVIVLLEENSGSNRHKVESVNRNGDIIIKRLIPEIGTSDMATWNIIIELNNNFKQEKFQVVLR